MRRKIEKRIMKKKRSNSVMWKEGSSEVERKGEVRMKC